MNNTLKKIVASITVLTCAVWMMGPGVAQALTDSQIQSILDLLTSFGADTATVVNVEAALKGEPVTPITPTVEGCTITSFDRNLKQAMSGDDVNCLQIILNSDSDTQLAESGVGSAGNETSYFGPLTKAAVITFQELYTEDCLASWGLTEGTGFVGSTTRAKLNELLTGPVIPTGCDCTAWEDVACGGGDCLATEMEQTRTCEPEEGAAEDVCEDVAITQCVADTSCVVGEGLTVALSADTPVTTAIPYGASLSFLKFVLSAGEEDVNIDVITLTAGGIGNYSVIDSVAMYDEEGTRVSSIKNISSDGTAIFNFATPLTIEAGTSEEITVKATITPTATEGPGQIFKLVIASADDILSDASAVNATFPIAGNIMSVLNAQASTATIDNTGEGTATASFGEDDVLLASFDVEAGADDLLFSGMILRNGGTRNDELASNIRLICDGEELATAGLVDNYVNFSFSPIVIEEGDSAVCEVRGDLGIGSADDTIELYIKDSADVVLVTQNTGIPAAVDITALDEATEALVLTLSTGDITIDFDRSATPKQEVRPDTKDVVLATLKITSSGEDATIESIIDNDGDFEIQGTDLGTGEVTNVQMKDLDSGGVYDITATFDTNRYELSLDEEIILQAGETKTFEIRADLTGGTESTTNHPIDNGDTLKVVLDAGAMSIVGDVSGEDITNILPSSITSAIATVEISSLTVTTQKLTNVSVVAGAEDIIVYQGVLEAGDASFVKLQKVTISTVSDASDRFSDDNIVKLDLYLDGELMKSLAGDISEEAGAGDSITFSSLNKNNVIPAGDSLTLVLKADFASTLTGVGSFTLGITDDEDDVISRDADNDLITESITSTSAVSRTVTLADVGTLEVELLTTDIKANKDMYTVAGSSGPTGRYLGELVFTTANEPVMVTELKLVQDGSATTDDIASVSLVKENGDVVITKAVESNGDVEWTNIDLEFPADEATSYFIVANTKGINVKGAPTSTATSGRTIQYHLGATANDGVVAEGVDSGEDATITAITAVPLTLESSGNGIAGWSTEKAKTGTYSVKLTNPKGATWGDSSKVKVLYGKLLSTITIDNLQYYYSYSGTAHNSFVTLYLDADGGDTVDVSLTSRKQAATTYNGTWTQTKQEAGHWEARNYNSATDSFEYLAPRWNTKTLAECYTKYPAAKVIYVAIGWGPTSVPALATESIYIDDITIGTTPDSFDTDDAAGLVSKSATVLGGAVTLIENDMADATTLVPGVGKIIGKYKVSIDTGSNRNSDNTPMEVVLTELKITLTSSLTLEEEATAQTIGEVMAYIEGDSSNKTPTFAVGGDIFDDTSVYTISLDSLAGEAYKVTDDVVLVIVADIGALSTGAGVTDYVQTEIDALSTDFTYTDGTTTALDKLTIDEVIGATLSE